MTTTPNYDFTLLTSGQAGAEFTMNDALNRIDSLIVPRVVNKTTTTSPASPSAGDTYIVNGTGGSWSTFAVNDVAFYDGAAWYNVTPTEGAIAYDRNTNDLLFFNGSAWGDYLALVESNISTNASNISTNTSNISTNTSNISTNTSNISTNASNISTNTSDIADLEVESLSGMITSPVVKNFVLDQSATYAYTVNQIKSQIGSGTSLTFSLAIGTDPLGTLTNITGISGQTSTTTEATDNATANNVVNVGSCLVLRVTANSGTPVDFGFTIKTTRN